MARQPKTFQLPGNADRRLDPLIQALDQHFRYILADLTEQGTGATGSFTTADGKTVTVTSGRITAITGP